MAATPRTAGTDVKGPIVAKTTQQPPEFADTAPYTVDYVHDCPAPVEAAFEVFKDNRGGTRWLGWFVTAVTPTSDPEHGVGSTRTVTFLYGLGSLEERFVAWEENRLWSFTATSFRPRFFSSFMERVTFEAVDETRCRIHYRAGIDFTALGRPFARPAIAFLNRAIVPTLERMSALAVEQLR
ncbi:SRPBCC family protein [Tsukamurella pseudospumae]|uniref:SRPBCC family protein n=1 Tax=Tsukamurella pseudospumae TaxID=239498 RepID=UPI0015861FBF|nr:SRPBCC family protein [Tsukamurella pseudospumae]